MSNKIVKTKASPAYVSNLEVDNLVINKSINEDPSVIAVSEDYAITTLGPSIVAANTIGGEINISLPPLAENIGRKIYVVNISAANSININAIDSDVISADSETSIVINPSVTTTILIGTDGYWEQVATGGGGGGTTEYDVITGKYDTGWIDVSGAIADQDFTITHNLGMALVDGLIVSVSFEGDHGVFQVGAYSLDGDPTTNQPQGWSLIPSNDNAFILSTGIRIANVQSGGANQFLTDSDSVAKYRVVVYDPNKIAAASSVEKYSTGWINSSFVDQDLVITHGLDAPLEDLIWRFYHATLADGSDAKEAQHFQKFVTTTDAEYGISAFAISNNQFKIQTGANGIRTMEEDGSTTSFSSGYYLVKVYKPTFIAREYEVMKYDTGWVSNSNWTSATLPINHNLGATLPNLTYKFFLSPDGTDATAFELGDNFRADVTELNADNYFGYEFEAVDSNTFNVHTPQDGIVYISGNQFQTLGGSTPYYYRTVVYKPALLEKASPVKVRAVSSDYIIQGRNDSGTISVTTGSIDQTTTLPDSSTAELIPGDEFSIHKADNGTGKVTVSRAGADTIEGDTSVALPSQYNNVRLRWSGSYWTILSIKANYDTGWVSHSSWQSASLSVTHNLGLSVADLLIRIFLSTDGTDGNSFEPFLAARTNINAVSADNNLGHTVYQSSTDAFTIETGAEGMIIIEDDHSLRGVDNENWYYRVVVRRVD